VPSPEACRVTISAAKAVSAEFEALPQQNLTVGVEGSGEGTVRSEPAGIECSVGSTGTCVEHFNRGSTVTLTAAPAPHSRFKEWVGLPCEESRQATCQIAISEDKAVDARFEAIPPQPLEVSVSGEGQVKSAPAGIACPPTCAEHFDEGSTVTLEALPAAHQQLAAWGGACAGAAASQPCQVRMAEAESVQAGFAPIAPAGALTETLAPASPPPPPPPAARLTLGKPSVKGTSATLKLSVSAAGSLSATGKGLEPAHAHASGAGAVELRLSLSAAGKRALARRGRLAVKVAVAFAPAAGAPASAAKTVIFKARKPRGARGKRH
jgi:hypothetical protein